MQFTIDTDLTVPSGVTCAFLDDYLLGKKMGALSGIGCACVVAERVSGVNAVYLAAHAALETGWGTSRIAIQKHNLFGWSAFDASPYSSAKGFPNRDTCILFVAGRIRTLYLTPGEKYFRVAPVLGKRGRGGYGMNMHYATDPEWGAKIARIAAGMLRAWETRG